MYLSLLKWSLYARIKRCFLNLKLFQKINKRILLYLFAISQFIKMITVFSIANLIINGGYILVNNVFIDSILRSMQNSKILILVIFCYYIVLSIYQNSIKAVKLMEDSKMKTWVLANTTAKNHKLIIIFLLENIIFSSFEILTLQVPVLSLLLLKFNYNIYVTFIIVSLYVIIIFLIILLNSLIYYRYLFWIKSLRITKFIIFINILKRMFIITISFFLGESISKWINEFPLIHRKVEVEQFENWINNFKIIYFNEFIKLNLINKLSLINSNKFRTILIMLLIIITLCVCILIINNSNKRIVEIDHIEIILNAVKCREIKKKRSIIWYIIKTTKNSKYYIRNINTLCGNIYYWSMIGFYTGALKYITLNSKVYCFLIVSYIFYPTYFLVNCIFENLSGKCCIDGEGKNIYFWINKNIFKLFKYKRMLFLINLILIVFATNFLIFILNNISIKISLFAFMTQIIFVVTLYNLFSLSSIIFPHFEHSSIEELNVYMDRKQLHDTLSFIIIFIGVPILVLPTVFYLTDYIINFTIYTTIQFIIIGILLILVNIVLDVFIKMKINSEKFVYLIFNK